MKKNQKNVISINSVRGRRGDSKHHGLCVRKTINALKTRSRQNSVVLGVLEYDWPVSMSIIEIISDYVGCSSFADNEPIIYDILEFGLERYSRFLFHGREKKFEDAVRIAAFIDGLITKTCEIAKAPIKPTVNLPKHNCFLKPTKKTFSDFVEVSDSLNELCLRRIIYELVANDKVQHILKSTNYEQAVVFGSLAANH